MKVAMGMNITDGSYGGGNQFGTALVKYLRNRNFTIVYELKDKDIDLILLTDPRKNLNSVAFGPIDVANYLRRTNSKAIVVQRINECDERKNTKTVNRLLCMANKTVDCTVYIASWLIDLMKDQGLEFTMEHEVILNGADQSVFRHKTKTLPLGEKIKIVTHHWSSNYMKGWDVYEYIDQQMTQDPNFQKKFEFHYIGNAPKDLKTKHIIIHPPCNGKELAAKLHGAHIYLTASINEPAGMHHIEGASCGLPLLYRDSGALPEYCEGYGISFNTKEGVLDSLNEIVEKYDMFAGQLKKYNKGSMQMCKSYCELFIKLIHDRERIMGNRNQRFRSLSRIMYMRFFFGYFRILNRFGYY